jgi:hypothetical protein
VFRFLTRYTRGIDELLSATSNATITTAALRFTTHAKCRVKDATKEMVTTTMPTPKLEA